MKRLEEKKEENSFHQFSKYEVVFLYDEKKKPIVIIGFIDSEVYRVFVGKGFGKTTEAEFAHMSPPVNAKIKDEDLLGQYHRLFSSIFEDGQKLVPLNLKDMREIDKNEADFKFYYGLNDSKVKIVYGKR